MPWMTPHPFTSSVKTVKWGVKGRGVGRLMLFFAFFRLVWDISDRQQTLMSTICMPPSSDLTNVPQCVCAHVCVHMPLSVGVCACCTCMLCSLCMCEGSKSLSTECLLFSRMRPSDIIVEGKRERQREIEGKRREKVITAASNSCDLN